MSTIRLTGTLVADAQCRLTAGADGHCRALIVAEVVTAEGDLPLCVHYWVPGAGYATELAAKNAARALRKGRRVTVYAAGLRPAAGGLGLRDVDCIRADDDTQARHYLERLDAA